MRCARVTNGLQARIYSVETNFSERPLPIQLPSLRSYLRRSILFNYRLSLQQNAGPLNNCPRGRGIRTSEPSESRRSPPPMDTRNSKGLTSTLQASWQEIGYLMEVEEEGGERE
ncbi:hypothetical protein EVAR_59706_1 [Eumeta japonica]|uniref:Uncharacterized protein n=1 Tax=Eumeta variegata TaxID=151549 RepID=A0A4C1XLJ0_EUMVA|nr:hypothetical protein EVAR_59706_1 [Eumeta japonica]